MSTGGINPSDRRKLVDFYKQRANTPPKPPGERRNLYTPDGGLGRFLGVLDEDLESDGEAVASIWGYSQDSGEEVSTTRNITVRGWFLPAGYKLPSGSRVLIEVVGSAAYVIQSQECPEEI